MFQRKALSLTYDRVIRIWCDEGIPVVTKAGAIQLGEVCQRHFLKTTKVKKKTRESEQGDWFSQLFDIANEKSTKMPMSQGDEVPEAEVPFLQDQRKKKT